MESKSSTFAKKKKKKNLKNLKTIKKINLKKAMHNTLLVKSK